MRIFLLTLAALLQASVVFAADINCRGKVTRLMDYPQQCNGNTAFVTENSNHKWICPPSSKGDALLLAALAADKIVDVYIDSPDNAFSCNNLPNYIKARYIIINP